MSFKTSILIAIAVAFVELVAVGVVAPNLKGGTTTTSTITSLITTTRPGLTSTVTSRVPQPSITTQTTIVTAGQLTTVGSTTTLTRTTTVLGGQIGNYTVCFIPDEGCASLLIRLIEGAL